MVFFSVDAAKWQLYVLQYYIKKMQAPIPYVNVP
jgi:hypothetical protein